MASHPVGEINQEHDFQQFTWTIPDFASPPKGPFIYSTPFYFCGEKLQMKLYPGGLMDPRDGEMCYIVPVRKESKSKFYINYKVSFLRPDGFMEASVGKNSFIMQRGPQEIFKIKLFPKSELLSRMAPNGSLTFVVMLRRGDPLPSEPAGDSSTFIELEKLSEDYRKMLNDKDSSDTVLVVRDKEFQAHKSVMAARSNVFAAMFRHNMTEKVTSTVHIPDCDEGTFGTFLEYMYSGRAEVTTFSSAFELYRTADKYEVIGLKSICSKFLMRNITLEDWMDALVLADQYSDVELALSVQNFFNRHLIQIVMTKDWKSLEKRDLRLANKLLQDFKQQRKRPQQQQALTNKKKLRRN